MNSYFPFELTSRFLEQPLPRVIVLADSDYKAYQANQAAKQVLVLQSRLNRYKTAMADLEAEITDLQTTHDLLPEGEPTPEAPSNPIKELFS